MNSMATFFRESRTARFFIPAGIILIIFGIYMFIINNNNQNYVETESTVTSAEVDQEAYTDAEGNQVEATYTVKLTYTVNEKEYKGELSGVSKHNTGDKMKIYYNPDNPTQITQTKSLILPVVIILAGVASLAGGIISSVRAIKEHKEMKIQEEGWKNGK